MLYIKEQLNGLNTQKDTKRQIVR